MQGFDVHKINFTLNVYNFANLKLSKIKYTCSIYVHVFVVNIVM